jgi:NADP+-dependent farnesol dehydrogenase
MSTHHHALIRLQNTETKLNYLITFGACVCSFNINKAGRLKYFPFISSRSVKLFTVKKYISKMSRWSGRIAVVTGASAGIGAAIVVELCKNGIITIGLARRVERVEQLRSELSPDQQKNFHAMKCDVSNEAEVVKTFAEIVNKFGGIDVLINNAGVASVDSLTNPDNSADMQRVIDTNVFGVINCTREAVKSIRERNAEAHIIHINSVCGHYMPLHLSHPSSGIYFASKFAVTALAEQHRQEFIKEKLNIKVTVS